MLRYSFHFLYAQEYPNSGLVLFSRLVFQQLEWDKDNRIIMDSVCYSRIQIKIMSAISREGQAVLPNNHSVYYCELYSKTICDHVGTPC